ncbi:hypothetical protein AQY21_04515 [Paracoccus sp. MKU1]|nr:hypothetical protein AQY21_04515 [Paracoccus sp. MKU1]
MTPGARTMALIRAGIGAAESGAAVMGARAEVLANPPGPGGCRQVIALGKAVWAMAVPARVVTVANVMDLAVLVRLKDGPARVDMQG